MQGNVIIVGGGMSGLYAAYKLLKKDSNMQITILEASDRIGGRVYTISNKALFYEGGAGRFSQTHKNLLKLIKELNLSDHIYPMGTAKSYIKDTTILSDFNEEKYIRALEKAALTQKKGELMSKTLLMFMREVLKPSEVDDLIYAFGYESEFRVCNAYHGIQSLKREFMANIQHFGMKDGLSTVVNKLKEHLETHPNVKILTNWIVEDINPKTMNVIGQTSRLQANKIIICVTKDKLSKFKTLLDFDSELTSYLTHINSQPLYRIYAKFPASPTKPAWFQDLSRICTNNALRHIIPINPKTGLIMISYTDGDWAQTWKQFSSKKTLEKEIIKHLKLLFPKKLIPDPEWIDALYWDHAVHYPGPNYKPYTQPHANKYIVCGEMMIPHGWVEGALMSVEKVFKVKGFYF